jgi:L-asparagine oxygenase
MNYLLVRNLPNLGVIPQTPLTSQSIETSNISKALETLKHFAYKYGIPTGYKQEQNGALIQHIIPNKKTELNQISSSSQIDLELHTETAFHPYKPSYLLLLCLRGDPLASTTYADIDDIVKSLDKTTIKLLREPLFITSIDESFRTDGEPNRSILLPVISEDADGYVVCFDEFFMRGKTFQAQQALDKFKEAISVNTKSVVLDYGDLLILNNRKVIHGRKHFSARYDGTDRWVLRILVMDKMPPDTEFTYDGHMVITTEF